MKKVNPRTIKFVLDIIAAVAMAISGVIAADCLDKLEN